MRHYLLILLMTLAPFTTFANSDYDALIKEGIALHDAGSYKKALKKYHKAVELDSTIGLAQYEISLTYTYLGEYEKAIEYSDKVIAMRNQFYEHAVMTKGSCLDYLGRTDESIELFENAIKEYTPNYLLYYNLAVNYYGVNKFQKAEETILEGLKLNMDHPGSHYLLAHVQNTKNERVKTLLSLHYFLFLEPTGQRAENAYTLLKTLMYKSAQQSPEDSNTITIDLDPSQANSEFSAAELTLGMMSALMLSEEAKSTEGYDPFTHSTQTLFKVLGELKEDDKNRGLWWSFYIPFFYDVAKTEHIEAYSHYIRAGSEKSSAKWLKKNPEKIENFGTWLQQE